jgi:hypothetical protein
LCQGKKPARRTDEQAFFCLEVCQLRISFSLPSTEALLVATATGGKTTLYYNASQHELPQAWQNGFFHL